MAYRKEASQTKNKIETHKMNTQVVYEHLKDVKEEITVVDLPCEDFYVNDFAIKKFKSNARVIAYEKDGKLYGELKHKNVVPKNIDYRHGNVFDMRGETIHWANLDTCSCFTEKFNEEIKRLLFGVKMAKKSVLIINNVKQFGVADKDFKQDGFQKEIVKNLYRLGHKKVSYFTCEYRSEQEGKKHCMTMIQTTFFIG